MMENSNQNIESGNDKGQNRLVDSHFSQTNELSAPVL